MKKSISLLLAVAFFVICSGQVFAETHSKDTDVIVSENIEDVIYYEDGSYVVITVIKSMSRATVTNAKNYDYYSDNKLAWRVQVRGSFYYDGLMSSCTSASHSVTIYDSSWSVSSQTSYAQDYRAIASVTLQKRLLGVVISTKTANVQLACDKYGNLS